MRYSQKYTSMEQNPTIMFQIQEPDRIPLQKGPKDDPTSEIGTIAQSVLIGFIPP